MDNVLLGERNQRDCCLSVHLLTGANWGLGFTSLIYSPPQWENILNGLCVSWTCAWVVSRWNKAHAPSTQNESHRFKLKLWTHARANKRTQWCCKYTNGVTEAVTGGQTFPSTGRCKDYEELCVWQRFVNPHHSISCLCIHMKLLEQNAMKCHF